MRAAVLDDDGLTALCEQLPDDLRIAASVALALHDEAVGEFLDRRIAWLADHFDRDPRTARLRETRGDRERRNKTSGSP